MSILGNRVLRKEDPAFLTVGGKYVADLDLPGTAWVTYVRSPVAHGRISSVDLDEARSAPGVIDVVTSAEIDLDPLPPDVPMLNQAMTRPFLAKGAVRFVGEPVVAIVSETREAGADASELVVVDYEPLHAVVDLSEARRDETLLFEEAGTNVAFAGVGDSDDSFFEGCDVVVRERVVNQRVAPCPLEVRGAAARWEPDGKLVFNVSTQAPHAVRDALVKCLGITPEQVQVVAPDVGGGFGSKGGNYPEELLVAWLARRVGRPCRWVETRSESMLGLGHGRAQVQDFEIGGSSDGKILAYRLDLLQDAGAYPSLGAVLPFLTKMMATGTYDIAKVDCGFASVVTNTTATTAYRGAGRPEATAVIERAVDRFAAEIGMDPAEVRRRNLVTKDRFPFQTPTGALYDSGDYVGALDLLLESSGYDALRKEQAERRRSGGTRHLGLGLSSYVEITNGIPGGEFGSVEVLADGKVLVKTGTSPHGQGHVTAWSMIVAEALGVDVEDVEVVHGDTDAVARGVGTFGSRSLQTGGAAVHQAAGEVVEKAKSVAASLLEADPKDVVLDSSSGRFHVAGTPAMSRSWAELAAAAGELGEGPLAAEADFVPEGPSFPFGCHLAVVEVDSETGKVTVARMVDVDDAGRILNPLLAEGQLHGGLAQGIAQALLEEFVYDSEGNPLTTNLADYAFISATELPSFESRFMETPTPMNALGAKGIGESGTIGSTPAVQNAVVDALSHLGVRHIDMPTTPERVWRALEESSTAPKIEP
ncbi:MAG TPA: xanthine dehydrogenase family protein molybdopterin-binding subunit [Acidimicrobiales bacterium]|nr:xanthine dehydrogenase family protein molybdopterin-binding subunit [Acidimicrobiales bacterium]